MSPEIEVTDREPHTIAEKLHALRTIQAALLERHFTRLTGLHRCYLRNGPSLYDTLRHQAERINNLKTQMAQMHKGYRRKIAKLERRIAELKDAAE